jgi:serine protease Do
VAAAAIVFLRVAFWHLHANDKRYFVRVPLLIFTKTNCTSGFAVIETIMKVLPILPVVSLVFGLDFGILTASDEVRNLTDIVKLEGKVQAVSRKVMPATVALLANSTESSGSGVITTEDGLILTAAHVVQGAEEVTVVFTDGEQVTGKVLGANYSKDIAMVQILGKGPWPFAAMGESKSLGAGDWVVALGHSAGFDAARTPPIRFGRVVSKGPGNFLTSDCTLIGGDSGGPLFDLDGKIVGINSSIGVSLTNNNHAGIDGFKEDWDRIRSGEAWGKLSMNPFANPEMPVLGIVFGGRRGNQGVPVEGVVPKSPAGAAGVRAGDVILSIDGSVIGDANKLLQVLAKKQPGDKVKLVVQRDRKDLEMNVVLARRDALFED